MKASTQQWLEYAKTDLMNCEMIKNEITNIIKHS